MKNTGVALFLLLFLFFAVQKLAIAATITFTNNCSYAVWPGTVAAGDHMPQLPTTGFELPIGASKSVNIPSRWSGRIWGRTGCSNDSGIFVCITGDCGSGQVQCNGAGTSPSATLVELTTASKSGQELYNVSLLNGFNLPMSIAPKGGLGICNSSSCPANVTSVCPEELQVRWSDGRVIACKSACLAFNEPEYCCTGDFNTTDKCQPTTYSQVFEELCPDAYSYAYDNIRLNGSFTCSGRPSYTITFCPSYQAIFASTPDSPADYLNAHNTARSQVGVPPLTWDNDAAAFFQNYANQRKVDCQLIHSGGSGGRYGENLAWSSGDLSGANAVKMWVDEKADYDYNTNTCAAGGQCGHYTQVVWSNTVRVGCAKVTCVNNGGTFIGCNYDPAGNIVGQKPY